MIRIQRIYSGNTGNGYRVLVDRLWPRGIRKSDADVDVWMKEIAPSNTLRKWFRHDPEKFNEFRKRYTSELNANPEVEKLIQLEKKHGTIILMYAARDEIHNQAVVLKEYLEKFDPRH